MPDIQMNADGIAGLIQALKLSSSAGGDEISSKLLKNTSSLSSAILSLFFQQSISTGEVPHDWKKAQIIPVHKSCDQTKASNYRPISLTSIPSKLLEHIIATNLMHYLESINFYSYQHGFRKLLSCETKLSEFTDEILQHMDNHLQTDAIFLDFSKAFDHVPHNHLLAKLSTLGIPQSLITWIEHFLKAPVQYTSVNCHDSHLSDVTSGVP